MLIAVKGRNGIADCLCKRLHHFLAVFAVIVFHNHGRLTVHFNDIECNLEFRHIEFHTLRCDLLPFHLIVGEHTNLVGIHNLCRQVIICRYLRKRIVLVSERLLEVLPCLANERKNVTAVYLSTQCQRIDEHTHRIRCLKVRAAVGYGGDAKFIGVSKPS